MKASLACLLASAATAVNIKASASNINVPDADKYPDVNLGLVQGDIADGYIDPATCTGNCWHAYMTIMSMPSIRGDTDR